MQAVLDAVQHLGFELKTVDVEKGFINTPWIRSRSGCYQEFEFAPRGYFNRLRELEISFVPEGDNLHVILEVDRAFSDDRVQHFCLNQFNGSETEILERLRGQLNL